MFIQILCRRRFTYYTDRVLPSMLYGATQLRVRNFDHAQKLSSNKVRTREQQTLILAHFSTSSSHVSTRFNKKNYSESVNLANLCKFDDFCIEF